MLYAVSQWGKLLNVVMRNYDYDFKALGVPGLTFFTSYINGDNIKVPGSGAEGKEWERDTEFKYQVQSGSFKDVSVRLRNSTYRSNYER